MTVTQRMDRLKTLNQILSRAAQIAPSKVGLVGSDGQFTFGELDQHVEELAITLVNAGIVKGDRVIVYLDKTARSVIVFQAILRVGAVYVPTDLQLPPVRVREVISGCSPRAIFTTKKLAEKFLDGTEQDLCTFILSEEAPTKFECSIELDTTKVCPLPTTNLNENDPAYILYTSGSTGTPKGICLSHGNAMAATYWTAEVTGAKEHHIFANHAPFSFSLSVYDLYVPFLVCGKLTIVPSRFSLSAKRLAEFISEENVTHWYSVPSAILLMMQAGNFVEHARSSLQTLIFAGEPFPKNELNQLRRELPETRIFNFYGATETNVSCCYEIKDEIPESAVSVPIGTAACGNQVWIEPSDHEDPTQGELIVKGPTVMLGYWGQELSLDITYRTSDIVQQGECGNYFYLGRKDNIVKVKGNRVSLSEIENTLLQHPSIRRVSVLKVGEYDNCKLIAFATLKSPNSEPSLLELKQLCAESLAPYKIINKVFYLDELPLSTNGKISKSELLESYLTKP